MLYEYVIREENNLNSIILEDDGDGADGECEFTSEKEYLDSLFIEGYER